MTLIAGRDTYVCDHCGAEAEAPEGNRGYPDDWGIYEYYPHGDSMTKGDLCFQCIAKVLPPKKAKGS